MIKIVETKLLHTPTKIIVQLVGNDEDLDNIQFDISTEYPHVRKEYFRFIKSCYKKKIDSIGKCQFIPCDVWALGLVDTLKNEHLDIYDSNFKYIACAFCQVKTHKKQEIDIMGLKECLREICRKAQSVKADVAIPYSEITQQVVQDVFDKSTVNVYLCKEN